MAFPAHSPGSSENQVRHPARHSVSRNVVSIIDIEAAPRVQAATLPKVRRAREAFQAKRLRTDPLRKCRFGNSRPRYRDCRNSECRIIAVMERRRFKRGFKLEAVSPITDRGVSCLQASEDLGVHTS
jgi:hypothetical protein